MNAPALRDGCEPILRRAAENAAATLARWLHHPVAVAGTGFAEVRLDRIPPPPQAGATATLAARVHGDLPGTIAVEVAAGQAAALVAALGGRLPANAPLADLGALERSMLQETANILFSSLMNSLAQHLGLEAVPHAPAVLVDIGTAAWDLILLDAAERDDAATVATVLLGEAGEAPPLRLVYLPAPAALAAIAEGLAHA